MDFFTTHPHLFFSFISVFTSGLAGILALAKWRQRGAIYFALVALSSGLWQFGQLVQNLTLIFPIEVDVESWSNLSFAGATFLYPSFFTLTLLISFQRRGVFKWLEFIGWISIPIFIFLELNGFLTNNLHISSYGYNHDTLPAYNLYLGVYFFFMFLGCWIVWPAHYRRIPQARQQAFSVFLGTIFGFGLGATEFISLYSDAIYPVADLAPFVFNSFLYYAIFRANVLGARELFRYILVRILYFSLCATLVACAFLIIKMSLDVLKLPVHLITVTIVGAFLLFILTPLFSWTSNRLKSWIFPVRHAYRPIVRDLSDRFAATRGVKNSLSVALSAMGKHFGYSKGWAVTFPSTQGVFDYSRCEIVLGDQKEIEVSPRALKLLQRGDADSFFSVNESDRLIGISSKVLSRRRIIVDLRSGLLKPRVHRKYLLFLRFLLRLNVDSILPLWSQGNLVGLLCFGVSPLSAEDWVQAESLLANIADIVANHLHQILLLGERGERERLSQIGLMSATLAHELKNPLGGIYGAAQILAEEAKGNTKFVNMILKDCERLNNIISEFLGFARATPELLLPTSFEVVSEITAFCSEQEALNGGKIKLQTFEFSEWVAKGNAGAFRQIMLNLVQNAIRYQAEGTPIEINPRLAANHLRIQVEDEGKGVDLENRAKLFSPFFTTETQGTGLGLATSRKLAREMGGDLYYEAKAKGSRFVLVLTMGGK